MSKKIKKIVIVGGGSAGWMTAATLIKTMPEKNIILIESPNISTVGVGESTLGFINEWLRLLEIKDEDFMRACDATYKLSIRFQDFYKKDSGGFHYPFGSLNTTGNFAGKNDWYFKKFVKPETPNSDYAQCIYPLMALVNENKISVKNDILPNYNFNNDPAYHFNAVKFANWLRTEYAIPKGVENILAEVKHIECNEEGVDYLLLDDGSKIEADLFIDCTGFRSILLAGAMKEPFIDLTHILPNNSAWAAQIPYNDKRKEMVNYTNCVAIQNGWVWNTPLWSRMGTGYVYSDKFISDEGALEQFKEYLRNNGHYNDEMNFNGQEIKFKNIKSRVGVHQRLWVKNVTAIGLSAGFIEPLESNGLFSVHEFLMKLNRVLKRDPEGYVSQWDKDSYNLACMRKFNGFSQFVALHYALSHRDDTEYWRDIGKRNYDIKMQMVDNNYRYIDSFIDAALQKFENYEFDDSGYGAIFTGMNFYATDPDSLFSYNFQTKEWWRNHCFEACRKLDEKKRVWKESVKDEPYMYDYLEQNIYNEM